MRRSAPPTIGLIGLLLGVGCGDDPVEPTERPPEPSPLSIELSVEAGRAQWAAPGAVLDAIVVRANGEDDPAEGIAVHWSAVEGGGSVEPERTSTDGEGRTSAVWTLGSSVGVQELMAVVSGVDSIEGDTVRVYARAHRGEERPVRERRIATGWQHTCSLSASGEVDCWGTNGSGELGTPPSDPVLSPRRVEGAPLFRFIEAGDRTTCGLTDEGRAYCWGSNVVGQLGIGSEGGALHVPTEVAGGLRFSTIALGRGWTCGLTTIGRTYCWGDDIGPAPVPSGSVVRFARLDVSFEACGLDADGEPYCWGSHPQARREEPLFGPGSPAPLEGEERFAEISLGRSHSCGVGLEGGVWCWGRSVETVHVPTAVEAGASFQLVTAGGGLGDEFTCGLTTEGRIECLGRNPDGQLGNGSWTDSRDDFLPVDSELRFRTIEAGDRHTCGIPESGRVHCWGSNVNGRLGIGRSWWRGARRIDSPLDFQAVAAGERHACALSTSGEALCWGGDGQSGETAIVLRPELIPSGVPFELLAAGGDGACALDGSGRVSCFGGGANGLTGCEPGGWSWCQTSFPLRLRKIVLGGVSPTSGHTCGLRDDGTTICWGFNENGQTGSPTPSGAEPPLVVQDAPPFVNLAANYFQSCGVTAEGEIFCWGDTDSDPTPDPLSTSTAFRSVEGGGSVGLCAISVEDEVFCDHFGSGTGVFAEDVGVGRGWVCALRLSGDVACWGENRSGELGVAPVREVSTPTKVPGLPDDVTGISSGQSFSCAVTSAGDVFCWGHRGHGQLGDGTWAGENRPVPIAPPAAG